MFTVPKVSKLVQRLVAAHVPTRLQHRISCGIQAFSLQPFDSINANGRSLAAKRKTGESRTYRVVHDERTAPLLSDVLRSLLPRGPLLYCSLDHSQFGPFCIAVLSVSVRRGRAIPVWCQVNLSQAGLITPLLAALEELAGQLPKGQKLVLVMDRWFCGPKLFTLICKQSWHFICRAKYDRRVWVPWQEGHSIPVGEISHYETVCWYHKRELRMVRSELRPGMKQKEPWFLLTNLPAELASRVKVLHRYEERFEIEEAFKDLKWLQRLEWQRVKKVESVEALLLFMFLGWWLAWLLFRSDRELQAQRQKAHPKHKLSWFRVIWEALHRLCWPEGLRFTPLVP